MERIEFSLPKPKKGIYTEEQALADEIWTYFGKELSFPRIMRIIKTIGKKACYEIFADVRQSSVKKEVALFVYLTQDNFRSIDWKNED